MAIYKVLFEKLYTILTLLTMSLFSRLLMDWGGGISCNDVMMTLGTVVPYPKKIQKIYKSYDTPLAFSWHEHFFTENQQILLYQEMQI